MKTSTEPKQMSEGWWDPIMFEPRVTVYRAPVYALDNATKPEVVIYGPKGESLVSRQPRRLGFRPPI